jgi:hypothetical protein
LQKSEGPYEWSKAVWEKLEVDPATFPLAEVIAAVANLVNSPNHK